MDLNDIPIFAMLKGKLAHTGQRQEVIARTIANADTPGYAPRDLKAFDFERMVSGATASGGLQAARTNPAHLSIGAAQTPSWESQDAADSEVQLDGNHVVLEEQMMKLTEARTDYDAAIGLYQKSLQMLRTAIKKPGQ